MPGKVYVLEQIPEGLIWVTKEDIKDLWNAKEVFPVEGISHLPFYITDLFDTQVCIQSLLLGTIYASDLSDEEVDKVKSEKQVDITNQYKFYLDLLGYLFHEIALESNILNLLYGLKEEKGLDFAIPFYRRAIKLLPSSKVCSDYISAEVDFLYNHPENRNSTSYQRILDAFNKIKKDEVLTDAWENLVITNYCITGLLGQDISECLYLEDLRNKEYLKVVANKDFKALFE